MKKKKQNGQQTITNECMGSTCRNILNRSILTIVTFSYFIVVATLRKNTDMCLSNWIRSGIHNNNGSSQYSFFLTEKIYNTRCDQIVEVYFSCYEIAIDCLRTKLFLSICVYINFKTSYWCVFRWILFQTGIHYYLELS